MKVNAQIYVVKYTCLTSIQNPPWNARDLDTVWKLTLKQVSLSSYAAENHYLSTYRFFLNLWPQFWIFGLNEACFQNSTVE